MVAVHAAYTARYCPLCRRIDAKRLVPSDGMLQGDSSAAGGWACRQNTIKTLPLKSGQLQQQIVLWAASSRGVRLPRRVWVLGRLGSYEQLCRGARIPQTVGSSRATALCTQGKKGQFRGFRTIQAWLGRNLVLGGLHTTKRGGTNRGGGPERARIRGIGERQPATGTWLRFLPSLKPVSQQLLPVLLTGSTRQKP